jgi:hypothetical protein
MTTHDYRGPYDEAHCLTIKRVEGPAISGVLFTGDPITKGDFLVVKDWTDETQGRVYVITELYSFLLPENMYQYRATAASNGA